MGYVWFGIKVLQSLYVILFLSIFELFSAIKAFYFILFYCDKLITSVSVAAGLQVDFWAVAADIIVGKDFGHQPKFGSCCCAQGLSETKLLANYVGLDGSLYLIWFVNGTQNKSSKIAV